MEQSNLEEYQLAIELDAFAQDYDIYEYRDRVEDPEQLLRDTVESIKNANVEYLQIWLKSIINDSPEYATRAKDLLNQLNEFELTEQIKQEEKPKRKSNLR